MKTRERVVCLGIAGMVSGMVLAEVAHGTPSTTYWTPATTDVQPYKTLHLGMDNYFTAFKKTDDGSGDFPTDVGLTLGILPFEKIQMEVGVDWMEPTDNPLFFSAKLGTPEGSLFDGSPAMNVGVFNVGTKRGVTDQNAAFVVAGKTIPVLGRLFAGYYIGNDDILKDGNGDPDAEGFMVGLDRGFLPVKDQSGGEYNRLVFAADYASGDNAIGGGGAGLYYFFTKNISLLTGPVFFNDDKVNGDWKWTAQLDINIPF